MNFVWALFGISVLLLVQKILGGEEEVYRYISNAPLALIQKKNTLELQLAIPHRVNNLKIVAGYSYDDKDEQGHVQEFKTACARHTKQQKKVEEKWRKTPNTAKEGSLFFLEEYRGWKMECDKDPQPSVRKTNEECGKSQGYIYEVGYPVSLSNEDEKNIQFMAIYEICYPKDKSMKEVIYTKHRIDSPSLMILKVNQYYEPKPWRPGSFQSQLDPSLQKVQHFYERRHIYQFVPTYDMPTALWENTTLFPFNYISGGGRNSYRYNLFKGMLKFDYIVRLVSKQKNKKFTFYSGPHQRTIYEQGTNCWGGCKVIEVPIISVWKVIIDEEKKATMLVTQITKRTCGTPKTKYICDQDRIVLEDYDNGGCTYKCSVDNEVLDSLPLPKLDIKGKLELKYTVPVEQESEKITNVVEGQEGRDAKNTKSSPREIDISNFGAGLAFVAALESVDATTAEAMVSAGAIDSGGNNNDDGGAYFASSDFGGVSDTGGSDMGAAV